MQIEIPVRNDMDLVIFSIVFLSEICYTPLRIEKHFLFCRLNKMEKD